ncbi:MAG: ATP-dependent DNA helicase [Holophagales bacterium]|nr:ATP-dependent DNA helicase [Holophagales bacterium]
MAHPMDKYFAPGTGSIFSCFKGAEERPGQRRMAELVWDSIVDSADVFDEWGESGGEPEQAPVATIQPIEAGTGIGKSLGYLIPAIAAGRNPVIVATRTKHLQAQLMNDDIPRAKGILGKSINAAIAKGRSNYLCITALSIFKGMPNAEMSKSDYSLWLALDKWVEQTETGDREELGRHAEGESKLWSRLNAERCIGSKCPNKDECFVTKMHQKLAFADLIIANTALLLADRILRAEGNGKILPDAPVLILDEAHEIEDQITDSCAEEWSSRAMTLLLHDLSENAARDAEAAAVAANILPWEEAWGDLMSLVPPGGSQMGFDDPSLDFGPLASAVVAWVQAGQAVFEEADKMASRKRDETLESAMDKAVWSTLVNRISTAFQRMEIIFAQKEGWVSTIIREGPHLVAFKASPIDVKPFFHKFIRRGFETVVMTSATLRDGRGFNGLRLRLGLLEEEAERGAVMESPFDFENQGMLFVPPGMPERRAGKDGVGEAAWVNASMETMTRLVTASRGRALLLFTSRKMLAAFRPLLQAALPPFTILVQGEGHSRSQLLNLFRASPNAILLGLASFWQGIDVPGDALVLVVVASLPFAPPDDPVVQARIREADHAKQGMGFYGYQVPQMTLKLKQGIGRLIRTKTDKGVVCILDPRLMLPTEDRFGKGYAAQVRAALPPFPITRNWKKVEEFLEGV